RVHGVAVVERQVAGLRVERDAGEVPLLAPRDPVLAVAMRSGEELQLAIRGIRVVELDARLDERTHDGMTPDPVVDVPAEIAVALDDVRVLDEHHRSAERIIAHAQIPPGQAREVPQARIVGQRLQHRRVPPQVIDAGHNLLAGAIDRPPREGIAGRGLRSHTLQLGAPALDLVGCEDVLEMDVSSRLEVVTHLALVFVGAEAAGEVERPASAILERAPDLRSIDRSARAQRLDRGLPALPARETPTQDLRTTRARGTGRGQQLLDELR